MNSALLSRSKVYVLQPLTREAVVTILRRAATDTERGLGAQGIQYTDDGLAAIGTYANGDARIALNVLEMAAASADGRAIDAAFVADLVQRRALLYDKTGEEHYNLISALHKSMRNSDPDASVYWLARMLEAGEDPLYVARRLVRFASEDIGNADPQALTIAVAPEDFDARLPQAGLRVRRHGDHRAAALQPIARVLAPADGRAARAQMLQLALPALRGD